MKSRCDHRAARKSFLERRELVSTHASPSLDSKPSPWGEILDQSIPQVIHNGGFEPTPSQSFTNTSFIWCLITPCASIELHLTHICRSLRTRRIGTPLLLEGYAISLLPMPIHSPSCPIRPVAILSFESRNDAQILHQTRVRAFTNVGAEDLNR